MVFPMDSKKFDRIIQKIREEMMTANAPGTQGGFGSNPPKPGVDGFDPVMDGMQRRKKSKYIYPKGLRKNWKKKEDNG